MGKDLVTRIQRFRLLTWSLTKSGTYCFVSHQYRSHIVTMEINSLRLLKTEIMSGTPETNSLIKGTMYYSKERTKEFSLTHI